MGIFDKIKDKVGSVVASVPTVKATMLGPRAVGKTSIMASIFSDSRNEVAGTRLCFIPQESCANRLSMKKAKLQNIITKRQEFADKPNTGAIEASNTVSSFDFDMGLKDRAKSINISIKDFPGEYLDSRPEEVSGFIEESHIVMIAIDTPYLMEEGGKYNDEKNEVHQVVSFFMNHPKGLRDKFILLVPLKCERYFHDGRIDEVTERVEEKYDSLLQFCKSNNIACAVTPIQTLGGVEFDKFIENTNPVSTLTKLSSYRFYGTEPEYKPMFCVQPLYYLLTYVANHYEWSKGQSKGFIDKLKDSLTSFLKDDDEFLHEIKILSSKIKVDSLGYKILNNNTILNIK
ncbi:MAG: hypothetical protein K2L80_09830 [Muribaculaceae bacterium]|nr:hypothetical protein [Muribaculaceae bacterium]